MTDELEDHLIALELRLQSSAIRKNAGATAELLSENFREFGASGQVWDRAAMLAELSAEPPDPIASTEFECQSLSSELALITYVASTSTRRTRRSSIWRLEGSSWRMVFHQGTVILETT